jgi:anaerobic selenocysteine-containing dehydrogenase
MDRRSFIKLTAVTGTSATLASCGSPEHQLIRFVPDEELVPGVAEWKPSVCPSCGGGCGVRVRVMDADVETARHGQAGVVRMGVAKKLEGHADYPVNQGGLCARGQASIQLTYHPDRLTQPLKRTGPRGGGGFAMITWDQAIADLVAQLDALDEDRHSLAFITGGRPSHRQVLIDWFLSKFGAPGAIAFQLFGDDVLRRANAMSFGTAQLPTFDLKHARFVIGFGADFLGTWNSPVSQSAGYGELRRGRAGMRGSFVQVESRMTTTGASADEWVPARLGTEGVLALGMAHVILEHQLKPATSGRASALIAGWSSGLDAYAPDKVEQITGIKAARIERLAREFAEQGPSVAIVGGPPLAQTNGLFTALAVNALNELAGAVGQPGGLHFTPQLHMAGPTVSSRQTLDTFAAGIAGGGQSARVLMVDGANPIFAAPKAWKVKDAFDQIPYIVSFASFIDETSHLADLILPDHSFLESWTDALPESGSMTAVAGVAPPAMTPLFQTRATADVLLDVARKLKTPLGLPWPSYEDMLKATFDTLGEDAWATAQKQGGWWGTLPPIGARGSRGSRGSIGSTGARGATGSRGATRAALVNPSNPSNPSNPANPANPQVSYSEPVYHGDPAQFPYKFLPYASLQFYDGSQAHLPWLQELPDPMTSGMWSSWVEINPKTAARLHIAQGDIVEITSSIGAVRSPAFLNPGLAPDLIAMPVGQGHATFTRYASGRGQNPIEILAPVVEADTGALAWAATRVQIARVGGPDGRLILFSAGGELREKPHEGETR